MVNVYLFEEDYFQLKQLHHYGDAADSLHLQVRYHGLSQIGFIYMPCQDQTHSANSSYPVTLLSNFNKPSFASTTLMFLPLLPTQPSC